MAGHRLEAADSALQVLPMQSWIRVAGIQDQVELACVTASRDEFQAELARMTASRNEFQAELARMTASRDQFEAVHAQLQRELDSIANSRWWRIGRALRAVR